MKPIPEEKGIPEPLAPTPEEFHVLTTWVGVLNEWVQELEARIEALEDKTE